MYRFYVVPEATGLASHSEVFTNKELFWDPYIESDAYAIINPTLKEEIGKAPSMEFTVLPSNIHYNDFNKKKTIVLAYNDEELLFEGVVLSAPVDFFKQKKVKCSGTLSYLCDSIQSPDEKRIEIAPISTEDEKNYTGVTFVDNAATNETILNHVTRILNEHNLQVNPFKRILLGQVTDDPTEHEFKSSNFRSTWDAIDNDIISEFGYYAVVRNGEDGNLYLDLLTLDQMVTSEVPTIEFARNMIELTENDDSDDDIFTILLPTGKDNLTLEGYISDTGISSVSASPNSDPDIIDPHVVSIGGVQRYVSVSGNAVYRYGNIVRTQSFSDVDNVEELYSRAVEYITINYDYHNEYEVKGIDLHLIDPSSSRRIVVGDRCRVYSKWHEIDTTMIVISIDYDFESPESNSYKIGIPTSERESKNKKLTSQVSKTSSKANNTAASYASNSSVTASKLDSIIHVTNNGLEMSTHLLNDVESKDQLNRTKFEQTDKSISLIAQKIFGEGDDDAGFARVFPESNANPKELSLYEKEYDKNNNWTGKYIPTDDTFVEEGKEYFASKLVTRISDIDVGEGGIHSRVNGNTLTGTMTSSWIDSNEDSILAITGHIHVDEEGNVIVDSGTGFRTGHTDKVAIDEYRKVPKSWLTSDKNPHDQKWYVMEVDSSGQPTGNYLWTNDTTIKPGTIYFYHCKETETFYNDFGIYDEGNLTAGIMVQAINHPQYVRVIPADAAKNGGPAAQGLYEYDKEQHIYVKTLDTTPIRGKSYFAVDNNFSEKETQILGDHIVIGVTDDYEGMDQDRKNKIDDYIAQNNLNGTITEIASDVVSVNALFAKFISFDDANGNTIDIKWLNANEIDVTSKNGSGGFIYTESIRASEQVISPFAALDCISIGGVSLGSVTLGSDDESISYSGASLGDVIVGFGTITTSGDTVKIPYKTAQMASDGEDFDLVHVLSFDKPASLGTVTWSSGDKLEVQTLGGKVFFTADLDIPQMYSSTDYYKKGSNINDGATIPSWLSYKPVIKAHMEITGTWTGETHDEQDDNPKIDKWSKDIYVDATDAYDDGWNEAWLAMEWPTAMQSLGERTTIKIEHPSSVVNKSSETTYTLLDADTKGSSGYVRLYQDYKSDTDRGLLVGAINVGDWYSTGKNDGIYDTSLKTVTWSSGEKLTLTTNSGNTYFTADLSIPSFYTTSEYIKNGSTVAAALTGYKVVKTRMTITGTWTGESHDAQDNEPEVNGWSKDIYVDASGAYDDGRNAIGISAAKWTYSGDQVDSGNRNSNTVKVSTTGKDVNNTETINIYHSVGSWINGTATVYTCRGIKGQQGAGEHALVSAVTIPAVSDSDWTWQNTEDRKWKAQVTIGGVVRSSNVKDFGQYYTDGVNNVAIIGPTSASASGTTEQTALDNAQKLGYGSSYMVYKADNGSLVGSKKFFKTPSLGTNTPYAEFKNAVYDGSSGKREIILGKEESVTVYSKIKADGEENYGHQSSNSIQVSAENAYASGIADAKSKFGLSGPSKASGLSQAEAQSVDSSPYLDYGTTYMVYKTYDSAQYGSKVIFRTRPSNANDGSGTLSTYAEFDSNEDGIVEYFHSGREIGLNYSQRVTVQGRYTTSSGAVNTDSSGIVIVAPGDRFEEGWGVGWGEGYNVGYGSVGTYAEYDMDNDGEVEGHSHGEITLRAGESVTVKGWHKPTNATVWRTADVDNQITITAPASSPQTVTIGIDRDSIEISPMEPSTNNALTALRDQIKQAISRGWWIKFDVTAGGSRKTYKMNFT